MPLEIATKTEELISALAMDSTLPRESNAAVGIAAAVDTGLAVQQGFVQRLKGPAELIDHKRLVVT
jgi:hypothetical protein